MKQICVVVEQNKKLVFWQGGGVILLLCKKFNLICRLAKFAYDEINFELFFSFIIALKRKWDMVKIDWSTSVSNRVTSRTYVLYKLFSTIWFPNDGHSLPACYYCIVFMPRLIVCHYEFQLIHINNNYKQNNLILKFFI